MANTQKLVLAGVGFAAVGIAVLLLYRARRKKTEPKAKKSTKNKQETSSVNGGTKTSTTTSSSTLTTTQSQTDTKLKEKTTQDTQKKPPNIIQPRAVGDESRIKGYWVSEDNKENYEFCDDGVFKFFPLGGYADGTYSMDPSSKHIAVDLVLPQMSSEPLPLRFEYKFNNDNEIILKTTNLGNNGMHQSKYTRSEKPKIKVPEAVAHKSKEDRYCIFIDKICELYTELENKIKAKANNETMLECATSLKKREEVLLAELGLAREDISCISNSSSNPKVKKYKHKLDEKTRQLGQLAEVYKP